MEEQYFETSFRFKWGTGFIIEALSLVLKNHGEFLPVTYLLEGQSYSFDRNEGEFVESDIENTAATPTNFVILLGESTLKKLLALADELGDHLKEELIVEFSTIEEPETDDEDNVTIAPVEGEDADEQQRRVEKLRHTYEALPLITSILQYTQLTIAFGEKSCIITDPAPKKMDANQNYFG